MLSCLYAMFVVVVGASLSLAEVLSDGMSIATFEVKYSSVISSKSFIVLLLYTR